MKKLFKAVAVLSMAAILIVVGVFAANQLDFAATASLVSFTSTSAYVEIECDLLVGNVSSTGSTSYVAREGSHAVKYTYSASSSAPLATVGTWDMGTLDFEDNAVAKTYRDKFQIKMKFTNNGTAKIRVTFVIPTTGTAAGLKFEGGYSNGDVSNDVESGDNVEFLYTVTLKKFTESVGSGASFTLPCTIETVG